MKNIIGILFLTVTLCFFSGCDLLHKHQFESLEYIEPTCTQDGYIRQRCSGCGLETTKIKNNTRLNHGQFLTIDGTYAYLTYVSNKGKAPTCTENGYTKEETCAKCFEVIKEREIIPANGHVNNVTLKGYEPTCGKSGLSDEIYCATCGDLLQEQKVISALTHTDANNNSLCDFCRIPYGDNIKYIYSVNDLRSINEDLNGVYQLMSNISLLNAEWTPIGSETAPFTGYLYGNGYAISDIYIYDNEIGGLISYNNGTIDSLTIKNINISVKNTSCVIGGFCAYNNGLIKNCLIEGNNYVNNSVYYYEKTAYPSYEGGEKSYIGIFGGMCGENHGVIEGCTSNGEFECKYYNKVDYELCPHPLNVLPLDIYDLVSNSEYYFGCMAGKNNGKILACASTSINTHTMSLDANKINKYGLAIANSYAYIGSITGVNNLEVENCNAFVSHFIENAEKSNVHETTMGGYGTICNLVFDVDKDYSCIIGKNNGTVKNTTFYY